MTVLAAIGETERSRRAAEIGYDLATTYDETLVALHVVPEADFQSHREAVADVPDVRVDIDQEAESARTFAERYLAETVEDLDREAIEPRGRVGDVAEEILAEAETVEPRYLVVGGRRRSPAGKALLGDTAQQILLNADCPVVTRLQE
jgi:nucleotide-binding universal stress UspA family protein